MTPTVHLAILTPTGSILHANSIPEEDGRGRIPMSVAPNAVIVNQIGVRAPVLMVLSVTAECV